VPPTFDRAAITLGIGPHSSLRFFEMTAAAVAFLNFRFLTAERVKRAKVPNSTTFRGDQSTVAEIW